MTKSTKVIAGLGVVAALGVAAMPFAGAFAAPSITLSPANGQQNVVVTYTVDGTLSLSVDGDKTSNTPLGSTADTSLSTTATVEGNTSYTLSLKGATTDLQNGHNGSIAAIATPATELSAGQWGYKITSIPTAETGGSSVSAVNDSNFHGVTTNDTLILTRNVASAIADGGEETVVNYGAFAAANQPAGTYTDTLTYTVAANVGA